MQDGFTILEYEHVLALASTPLVELCLLFNLHINDFDL